MTLGRKKAPVASQYSGGQAKPAYFSFGEDFEIKGYWLHPTKHLYAEIAIFDHAYYPKLDATDTEIDQNITWRKVSLPSLQELRSQGISVDEAIVVSEVNVPPRHIKNRNFFRTNFPAMVKQTARQNNFAIVFPASDMPSARFKRKEVLNLYRSMFSPLIINGKQYSSGRMSFFFTAPKESTRGFKKSFNLEESMFGRRKRGTSIQVRRHDPHGDIVDAISFELENEMLPVVANKIGATRGSEAYNSIHEFFSSKKTAEDLVNFTNGGKDKGKIRIWVDQKMIPYIKGVAKQEGLNMADSALRFVLRATATVIIGHIFSGLKVRMPNKLRNVNVGSAPISVQLGGVNLSHQRHTKDEKTNTAEKAVFALLRKTYGFDRSAPFEDFVDVAVNGNNVRATMNAAKFQRMKSYLEVEIGDDEYSTEMRLTGVQRFIDIHERQILVNNVLPLISHKVGEMLRKQGSLSAYSDSSDVSMFFPDMY